jgi:hypothetical protein
MANKLDSRRRKMALWLGALLLYLGATEVSARVEIGDFEVSGEIFVLAEARIGGSPDQPPQFGLAVAPDTFLGPTELGTPSNGEDYDTWNALRTEFNIEFVYKGIPHVTPVVKLRGFYDGMYDVNDRSSAIAQDWKTNLGSSPQDKSDPFVREAYLDINYEALWVRLGRQIVTWGRSDGVTVLDVVTPRNFRNPLTFEQERFMIPQDMLNIKLDLDSIEWLPGITKELQVIWNWDYTPARFPGFKAREEGQHPWTLQVVDYANQIINVSDGLFGEPDFFDGDAWDEGSTSDKSEYFVRWRARTGTGDSIFSDMTYSIHYADLIEDIPVYRLGNRIDAGFGFNIAGPRAIGGGIDFDRHRYSMAGLSFDKALMSLPGPLEGTVLRAELVYNFDQLYYEPDLETIESDSITTVIGLDQYLYLGPKSLFKTPWFVSVQYWRDQILDKAGSGQFTNLGTVACDAQPGCGDRGYVIGGASTGFDGLRDETRNVLTLFMFNDFLPGKTLHVELFALHELGSRQNATWLRGVVGYNFNRTLSGRLGVNYLTGESDAFFGQFERNTSAFIELKVTF